MLLIFGYFDTLTWAIIVCDLGRADYSLSKSPTKISNVKVFMLFPYCPQAAKLEKWFNLTQIVLQWSTIYPYFPRVIGTEI